VEAREWCGEVFDAVGMDVVCSEGSTETCLSTGGAGRGSGGTGVVGGAVFVLLFIPVPVYMLCNFMSLFG
jgi:hypothetical protein